MTGFPGSWRILELNERLKNEILKLETELMDPKVRKDAVRIAEIMDREYFEFGASGGRYKYKAGDTFFDTDTRSYEMMDDFCIKKLDEKTLIATYTGKMTINGKISFANRSSIWQHKNGEWRIVFHQGTPRDS